MLLIDLHNFFRLETLATFRITDQNLLMFILVHCMIIIFF
jgi:hypothetical protein